METKTAIASVATVVALALAGCSSEDVDPQAVPGAEEAGEDARAEAEEALADLRTEAEQAADELQTPEAPEVKQEILDRCNDALASAREADLEATGALEEICDRIEAADVRDMDLWNEIQQQIEDFQMS